MSDVELTEGEKNLVVHCVYCCQYPIWDLWEIDVGRNDERVIVQEWQLKCKGSMHSFGISYSQDKMWCIRQWNEMMQKLCNNEKQQEAEK